MRIIKEHDLIVSIAEAMQFISYFHPTDFILAMKHAWENERSPTAKAAIGQILQNSRLCAIGKRPICQDTGVANVNIKIGAQCFVELTHDLQTAVDEAVRIAYLKDTNPLRASIVSDPLNKRVNTDDNTPAMLFVEIVSGNSVEVEVSAKGGGSENKTKFVVLNPSDSVSDWVVETVSQLGAGWCPPGMLGIGVGGSVDKAMVMAKQALNLPIDMTDLLKKGPKNKLEALRIEIYERVNQTGIGAQGLGGDITVLDVKINSFPTHAASLPIALIPNCAATRHVKFKLDGTGPANFEPPDLSIWPTKLRTEVSSYTNSLKLDEIDEKILRKLKAGDRLLLTGKLYTGRDAAHKRILDILDKGESLPLSFKGRAIYYVGPVDAVRKEVIGPAGPTTASRMDKFTEQILEKTGLKIMIGKGERSSATCDIIRKHKAVYMIAVGGAAFLISKAIKSARVVAFEDLGMEAIYELRVKDFPVTVAVDCMGNSIHKLGPELWRERIK
tara:strand:+ start:3124 stop:4623 length:1500 start_codon:yes stop_codon:yes gene_type:complete